MYLSQFCKNELQAQYSFTYQTQYIANLVDFKQKLQVLVYSVALSSAWEECTVQRQFRYFSDWIEIMSQPQNHQLAPQWRETAQATTQTGPTQHSLGVECPRSRQVWW